MERYMANTGENVFFLHKLDDRSAYELVTNLLAVFPAISRPIHVSLAQGFNFPASEWGEENIGQAHTRLESSAPLAVSLNP